MRSRHSGLHSPEIQGGVPSRTLGATGTLEACVSQQVQGPALISPNANPIAAPVEEYKESKLPAVPLFGIVTHINMNMPNGPNSSGYSSRSVDGEVGGMGGGQDWIKPVCLDSFVHFNGNFPFVVFIQAAER